MIETTRASLSSQPLDFHADLTVASSANTAVVDGKTWFYVVDGQQETYLASYGGTNVEVTWEFESGASREGDEVRHLVVTCVVNVGVAPVVNTIIFSCKCGEAYVNLLAVRFSPINSELSLTFFYNLCTKMVLI